VASASNIVGRSASRRALELLDDSPTELTDLPSLVSVVVPLFNEEATVAALYDQVRASLDGEGLTWEIVYVDDGSTDGSHQALVQLHTAHNNVRVVRMRRNFGKAAALSAGFEAAQGDVVVTMDADLQDDPSEIPHLLAKLSEGYDLVSGWKCDRRDPFARRIFSRVYNRVTSLVTGVRLHDMNCGLKIYRAEVLQNVRLYGDMHRFVPVLAHHLGFRTTEIPVNHRPRLNGRSRYGIERYTRGFFDLLTVAYLGRYRHRPLHFFGGVGMLLGAGGFAILLYLTALKLGGAGIGGRPLLMLGILLVVVGIQFFSLGLVGELLTSHHEEKSAATSTGRAYVRDSLR
jgi:glycosyltransferase involved in cell wall biosynthesis